MFFFCPLPTIIQGSAYGYSAESAYGCPSLLALAFCPLDGPCTRLEQVTPLPVFTKHRWAQMQRITQTGPSFASRSWPFERFSHLAHLHVFACSFVAQIYRIQAGLSQGRAASTVIPVLPLFDVSISMEAGPRPACCRLIQRSQSLDSVGTPKFRGA